MDMNRLYIRDKVRDYLNGEFISPKDLEGRANKSKKRVFNAIGWYCKKCKSIELDK
jgi:hypothetical protein